MSEFSIGQIVLFAYDRVPHGFLRCEGQTINYENNRQLELLHSLVWTKWSKERGKREFTLPDLRDKSPDPSLCYMICVDGLYPNFES